MSDRPHEDTETDLADRIRSLREAVQRPARPEEPGTSADGGLGRIGVDFVSFVLASVLIGWLLDRTFNSAPWALLVTVFLGFIAAVVNVGRALKAADNAEQDKDRASKQGRGKQGKDTRGKDGQG